MSDYFLDNGQTRTEIIDKIVRKLLMGQTLTGEEAEVYLAYDIAKYLPPYAARDVYERVFCNDYLLVTVKSK